LAAFGSTITPSGEWVHMTGVLKSDGTVLLYKNGILDGSAQSASIAGKTLKYQTHETAKIGAWGTLWGPNYLMDGQIDEVQIYNRALSAAEIQAIYNSGSAGTCQPAYLWVPTGGNSDCYNNDRAACSFTVQSGNGWACRSVLGSSLSYK